MRTYWARLTNRDRSVQTRQITEDEAEWPEIVIPLTVIHDLLLTPEDYNDPFETRSYKKVLIDPEIRVIVDFKEQ